MNVDNRVEKPADHKKGPFDNLNRVLLDVFSKRRAIAISKGCERINHLQDFGYCKYTVDK